MESTLYQDPAYPIGGPVAPPGDLSGITGIASKEDKYSATPPAPVLNPDGSPRRIALASGIGGGDTGLAAGFDGDIFGDPSGDPGGGDVTSIPNLPAPPPPGNGPIGSGGGDVDFNGNPIGGAGGLPSGTPDWIKNLFGGGSTGGTGGISGILGNVGSNPLATLALLAGIFEKPDSPLLNPTVDALKGAISSGQKVQGLPVPGITPSFQRAIDTANENAGAWKPALDESADFTRSGGAAITGEDTARYMNPYIEQALDPAARKIKEAASLQRMSDAAKAGSRGAFGTSRNDQLQGLNERNELTALGDLYGQGYANAYNTALTTAGADKGRALTAGGAFRDLGTTTSNLGKDDIAGLTSAGGIETLPFSEEVARSTAAGNILTGAGNAGAKAIDVTSGPSMLTNIASVLGLLNGGAGGTGGAAGGANPSSRNPSGTSSGGEDSAASVANSAIAATGVGAVLNKVAQQFNSSLEKSNPGLVSSAFMAPLGGTPADHGVPGLVVPAMTSATHHSTPTAAVASAPIHTSFGGSPVEGKIPNELSSAEVANWFKWGQQTDGGKFDPGRMWGFIHEWGVPDDVLAQAQQAVYQPA